VRDRVDEEPAEVRGWVRWGVGQLGADRGGVAQAAGLPGHVAACVHEEQAQAGVTVQDAGHYQALRCDRRLQLISDRVLEVVALQPGVRVVVCRVQHQRKIQPFGRRPERVQARLAERDARYRSADVRSHGAGLGRGCEERGRRIGCLQRHVRQPAQAGRLVGAERRHAVVDRPAQRGPATRIRLVCE
jgi:hypothetical protein